ncbi:hypothetical protein FGO68_gene16781 [Halteria grandinella]|uniref:Uncharacterized protein n=1 Tax=Halteria grandinella TaxID=5974 RepID=A0A8J8T9U9_HALGN|nr:hypothetical protein FGO68_gene16781 [Halteria grandinella]
MVRVSILPPTLQNQQTLHIRHNSQQHPPSVIIIKQESTRNNTHHKSHSNLPSSASNQLAAEDSSKHQDSPPQTAYLKSSETRVQQQPRRSSIMHNFTLHPQHKNSIRNNEDSSLNSKQEYQHRMTLHAGQPLHQGFSFHHKKTQSHISSINELRKADTRMSRFSGGHDSQGQGFAHQKSIQNAITHHQKSVSQLTKTLSKVNNAFSSLQSHTPQMHGRFF